MKQIILILIQLASLNTMAEFTPGDTVTHDLRCGGVHDKSSGNMSLGAAYSMKCTTQPLPPQYALRNCELYIESVTPGAEPSKVEIKMKIQSVYSAYFETADHRISVLVEKGPLNATVSFDDREEMNCSADHQP